MTESLDLGNSLVIRTSQLQKENSELTSQLSDKYVALF